MLNTYVIIFSDNSKTKSQSIPSEDEEFCSIMPLNSFPFQNNSLSSDLNSKHQIARNTSNSFDDSKIR